MSSKIARDLIIALAILAAGIKLVMIIFNNYLSKLNMPVSGFSEFTGAAEQYGTWMIYGLIILIVILIPFYLSKRSDEKKTGKGKTEQNIPQQQKK